MSDLAATVADLLVQAREAVTPQHAMAFAIQAQAIATLEVAYQQQVANQMTYFRDSCTIPSVEKRAEILEGIDLA